MNLKDTLLMPKTSFEMKANLNSKEENFQSFWLNNKIYEKLLIKNKNNDSYVFLDGPPYANGNIHIGHALNKVLKDINIRFQNLQGKYCPFMLGWDTHGLPIEHAIEATGVSKHKFSRHDFRKACKEYALNQISIQQKQMQRLGLLTDYKTTYYTLNQEYEYEQISYFYNMLNKGLIYQNFKPVYWSWSSESALAEAEVEYLEKTSNSIFVKLDIIQNNEKNLPNNTKIVFWTTTPWTLPGNQAIALNPAYKYCLISNDVDNLIICEDLFEKFITKTKLTNFKKIKNIDPNLIVTFKYIHPLYPEETKSIIFGNHVTNEDGTGFVHTAPGHGLEDYIVGLHYKLPVHSIVNEKGILEKSKKYDGIFYAKAEKIIIEELKQQGSLLFSEEIRHQYPHDWRTKKPVLYRATLQWFISINKIKSQLVNNLKNVETFPKWGQSRLMNMVENRDDWCISRQRYWGLPIAVFYDENKKPVIKEDLLNHLLAIFKKHGIDIWYEWDVEKLLPEKYKSFSNSWTKELDIMDVWFDSGTAFSQLQRIFDKKIIKADLFLEGNDQFRGWFNSSLIISTAINDCAPFEKILSHGFVLDEQGYKMSKSKGNVVDPLKVIQEYGADILRMWTSSVNYLDDVRIGKNTLNQISENYRKIRNTIKFLLGNLFEYDFMNSAVIELKDVDKFMLSIIANLDSEIKKSYEEFKYDKVVSKILNFCINEMSGFYLDFAKDILYVDKQDSSRRKQIQYVMFNALQLILKWISPIIPHTCEEAFQSINEYKKFESIMLYSFGNFSEHKNNLYLEHESFWKLKSDVYKALEKARNEKIIGKSLEASINIKVSEDFKKYQIWDLRELFMVSKLQYKEVANMTEFDSCKINIYKDNELHKCERCWRYFDILENKELNICKRCSDACVNCEH